MMIEVSSFKFTPTYNFVPEVGKKFITRRLLPNDPHYTKLPSPPIPPKPPAPQPHKSKPKKKKIRPRKLNKLYKKLAQKIHPDKKGGSHEDFQKLQEVIEDSNIEEVLELADDYNIDVSEEIEEGDF